MKTISFRKQIFAYLASIGFIFSSYVLINSQTQSNKTAMSRYMEQAIRLYHDGQDTEAMDRFMEILVKGTPSEKALANEYISKITLRMNTGINPPEEEKTDAEEIHKISEEKATSGKSQEEIAVKSSAIQVKDEKIDEASEKKLITQKISSKILEMRKALLIELGKVKGVKIFMGEEFPKAISLDSNYFFAKGEMFRPNVNQVLAQLAGLIFTLGKANCLILPEGIFEGEVVKLMNIRRAIILNNYFINRGISPSRMDVKLTGSDIKLPKELYNLSGLIILFDYNKSPVVKQVEDLNYKGPRISLGIYPTSISTTENNGAIIEFSVFETPIGPPTWKYQIFQVQSDNTLLLLDDISGNEAVYHQSYWNGRKKFFGENYPPGKYMFSLTASDINGKENIIRRLLIIKGKAVQGKKLAQAGGQSEKKNKQRSVPSKPSSSIIIRKNTGATTLDKRKKQLPKSPVKRKKLTGIQKNYEAARQKISMPDKQVPKTSEFSSQVYYRIYFNEETASVTPNSEKKMVQVAETMKLYPMAKLKLIGYAYSGEPDSHVIAEKRVDMVANLLVNRYSVSRDRIQMQTKTSDRQINFVEVRTIGKE